MTELVRNWLLDYLFVVVSTTLPSDEREHDGELGTVVEVGWSDLELFGDETLMWLVGLVKDDEEDDTILELSICCDEGTWFDEVPMKMDCDEVAIADLFLLPDGDVSL